MRLAIAQIPMHWTVEANLAAMTAAMRLAQREGATACAFSELAVTGFHRRVPEWTRPEIVGPAVERVCAEAAALGLAVAFGAPGLGADGTRRIDHLLVEADGREVGRVAKIGLTAPEATFFVPGEPRRVLPWARRRASAVICREIEDEALVLGQLAAAGGADLLLWPGGMRPDPALPPEDPPRHVRQAQALARAAGAWIVQTNWPNALNRPEESAGSGRSVCIGPEGEVRFALPEQGCGVAVFELGASTYAWHADAAA